MDPPEERELQQQEAGQVQMLKNNWEDQTDKRMEGRRVRNTPLAGKQINKNKDYWKGW